MKTDKEKHGLNGPVKDVVVETTRFEGQAEKPWFSNSMSFNRHGQATEQVYRSPDGSEWRTVSDYSDSGNLLAMKTFDSSGVLHLEMRYIYDTHDRLVAEQQGTADGRVTTQTTYAYEDSGGKVKIETPDYPVEANVMMGIEGISTSINVTGPHRIESRYNDRNKVVEVRVFDTGGTLLSRIEITYDARGNPLEETQYVGGVVPFNPCESGSCSTEEMAALTEEQKAEIEAELARLFSPGTPMSKHTHRYDTEGRLIESKLTMMGMDVTRQTFAYDEAGNKSEEVSYNEEGTFASKAVFEREYDEYGNWTSELVSAASSWDAEFGLSTPAHVTRRLITYW